MTTAILTTSSTYAESLNRGRNGPKYFSGITTRCFWPMPTAECDMKLVLFDMDSS